MIYWKFNFYLSRKLHEERQAKIKESKKKQEDEKRMIEEKELKERRLR